MATPISREDIIAALAAVQRALEGRVTIWRVIVDEHGQPTGQRIYRGSFPAPPNWQPPSFDDLITCKR